MKHDVRISGWCGNARLDPATSQDLTPPPHDPATSAPPPQADQDGHQEDQQQIHPDLVTESTGDEATEQALTQFAEGTAPDLQLAVIDEVINNLEGDISEEAIGTIASQMQIEPEKANEMVDTVRAGMEAQARSVITDALGGNAELTETMLAWAYDQRGDEVSKAVREQLLNRRTAGYAELAKEFMANLDTIAPDAILNAEMAGGVSVTRDDRGRIVVRDDRTGRTYGWRSAVEAGIISLEKAGG